MRPSYLVALFLPLALAGCVGDAVDTGPVDPYATREIAAVHLDTVRGGRGAQRLSGQPWPRGDAARSGADGDGAAAGGCDGRGQQAVPRGRRKFHLSPHSFRRRYGGGRRKFGAGHYSLEEAMTGWRNSPEHNANLLMPKATRLGIAIAKDPRTHYGVYWAMERPRAAHAVERTGIVHILGRAATMTRKRGRRRP